MLDEVDADFAVIEPLAQPAKRELGRRQQRSISLLNDQSVEEVYAR